MYEPLIAKFSAWANAQSDIRAAIIVGSQARTDHPADAWADLDILTYVTDPDRYEKPNWLADIGTVWAKARQRTFRGDLEWLVTFAQGRDVDFVFLARGYRVLLDRDALIAQTQRAYGPALPSLPPTENEFL